MDKLLSRRLYPRSSAFLMRNKKIKMKDTHFYLEKANNLLKDLQAIDIDQLNEDIRNQALMYFGSNRPYEIKTENLNVLNDIEFQTKLLLSTHRKSEIFLERLETKANFKPQDNESEKLKNHLIKVLNEFTAYLNEYEIE